MTTGSQRSSIQRTILGIVIAGIILLMATAGASLWRVNQASLTYEADVIPALHREVEIMGMESRVREQSQEWKNLLMRGGDPASLEKHWAAFQEIDVDIRQHLDSLLTNSTDPDVVHTLEQFRDEYDRMQESYRSGYLAFTRNDFNTAYGDLQTQGIDREANALLERALELMDAEANRVETESREQRIIALWGAGGTLIAISLALVGGIVLFMTRLVIRPIQILAERMRTLTETHDLTIRLRFKSQDEIGLLGDSVNRFLGEMQEMITQMTGLAAQVSETAATLQSEASELSDASGEVARNMSNVAGGAAEQARQASVVREATVELQQAIGQIASGAEQSAREAQVTGRLLSEMIAQIEAVAAEAVQIAESARLAHTTARSGGVVVERANEGMTRIAGSVSESAERVARLEQISAQIGEITAAISAIAEQTNLLALNAAIEAARAGEHGRGFAVVAEEVRRLADRSAQSAREIGDLVHRIQEGTASVSATMTATTQQVEQGSTLSREAGVALRQIEQVVSTAVDGVQRIAEAAGHVKESAGQVASTFESVASVTEENTAATEEMSAGAQTTLSGVQRVNEISTSNAGAVQETSAASEQLNASAQSVNESATRLAEIAARLHEQATRFQV